MKALTVRQPWAWAIMLAGKDVENRDWFTHVRERIAIHAAAGMTRREYDEGVAFIRELTNVPVPPFTALSRGMVLGTVDLIACVNHSRSPWFRGQYGFLLRDPQLLPTGPIPAKGALGFWDWSAEPAPAGQRRVTWIK